jgi:hypothetical protein
MKMSGSIRRTERKNSRSVANRESPPLPAFPDGTALPGSDVHYSGPGSFFPLPPKIFCTVPKSVPSQRTFTLYFAPLERKSRCGQLRSNSHE